MSKVDLRNIKKVVNPAYYHLLKDRKYINVLYGGASSGKSHFVDQRIVFRVIVEDGHNYLVLRKVDRTNRISTFSLTQQVINQFGMSDLFTINKSDMTITCKVNDNQIIFKGLDNREKLKSITCIKGNITDIWIEEATEINIDDWKQVTLRLRGKSKYPKQITLTFNPIDNLSWAKRVFFDMPYPKDKCTIMKSTYKDNCYLEQSDKEAIERLKKEDPTFYKIYALGEWGSLGNLVFSNYVIEDFKYRSKDFDAIYAGMDFGTNHPFAIEIIGVKDGELYIFNEIYMRGLTNNDIICKNEEEKVLTKNMICVADSAEPDRIKEWQQAGYKVTPAKKGKDSVRYGLDFLRRKRIHIHKNCAGVAAEFQTYSWKQDKDGNVLDEPVGFKDDGIAALRYAFESVWNRKGRVSKVSAYDLGL